MLLLFVICIYKKQILCCCIMQLKMAPLCSVALCVFITILFFSSSVDTMSKEDIQEYIDDVIADFQVKLRLAAHDQQTRLKREITLEDFKRALPQSYESQVLNITPWLSVPSVHPVEIEPFSIKDEQYLAVVNFKNEQNDYNALSTIFKLANNGSFTEVQQFATSGGIDFEYVEMGFGEKYAIFLDYVGRNFYGSPTYERWFKVNQYLPYEDSSKPFQYKTKVRALGATSVKVFQRENSFYFLTANSFYEIGNQYHVKSTMHLKVPYGYLMIQEFDTHGAQDVEVIMIDGVRYILFANHQDNTGSVDIYSFVYKEKKMHEVTREDNYAPFGLYQRLLTHGGRDFEYFEYQNNHYLVAINEYTQSTIIDVLRSQRVRVKDYNVDSVIYWWTGKLWVEWQRIPTQGARKATYFKSDYGDPMLVICNSKSQAVIYTHDPLRGIFKPTNVQGLSPFPNKPSFIPDVRSVHAFKMNNETYLAVANYNLTSRTGYNIFKISFEKSLVSKLDPTIPELVTQLIADMKRELEMVKNTLTKMLLKVTDTVLTRSTPQNLTMLQLVQSKITELKTSELIYRQDIQPINPVHNMAEQAVLIKKKIDEQEEILKNLLEQFQDLVFVDKQDTINAKKTFKETIGVGGKLIAQNVEVGGLVDGVDVVQLNNTAFKNNVEQTVTGKYVFQNKTVFEENIDLDGKMNGIHTAGIMTVATSQTFLSPMNFDDNVTLNNDVLLNNFTLNDIRLSNVVTKSSQQTITGSINYPSVNLTGVVIDGLLQDVNITDFHSNKVSSSKADMLQAKVIFNKGFRVLSDVDVTGKVDGVNLDAFFSDIKMTGKDEVISGVKTFKSINILGSSSIEHINGNNMNSLATISGDNTFTKPVVFTENMTLQNHLRTNSTINGLVIHNQVVLIHSNTRVSGSKTFTSSVHVDNNITVHGNVNGLSFNNLVSSVVLKNQKTPVTGAKIFANKATVNSLTTNSINNIDMITIHHGLLSILPNTTWYEKLQFETIHVTGDSKISGTVNGYRIPEDFVLLGSDQTIEGPKTFINTATFENSTFSTDVKVSKGDIHGFLENAVRKSVPQSIPANLIFDNSVHFEKNSNIAGLLNGNPVSYLGTITTEQNFTGTVTLTTETTMEDVVNTHTVDVQTTVNSIDISEMEKRTVYKDRNQTINGSIVFVAGIDCKQNLSVAGLINGVNLSELYDTSVRISRPQYIQMQQTFTSDVNFQKELTTSGNINNVNITELSEISLKKHDAQTLTGELVFQKSLNSTEHVTTQSFLNNINIHHFLDSAVLLEDQNPVLVNGSLRYSNLYAEHVTASTISAINTSNVLLTTGYQVVTGQASFTNISSGPLSVKAVNGLNITAIDHRAMKVSTTENVTGKYTFQNNVQVHGSLFSEKINNVDVGSFVENAVDRFSDDMIYGSKHFHRVSIGNLVTSQLIGSVNVTTLLEDALLRRGSQNVCHKKVFKNKMAVNEAATFGDIHGNKFVNAVNLTNFQENAVNLKKHETLYGNYTFDEVVAGNVYVDIVNGLDISNEFLLTTGNQTMIPSVTFNSVEIRGNLNVLQFIDGVDLNTLERNRISYDSDSTISGNIGFATVISKEINMAPNATINHVRPDSLVSRTEDASVDGVKLFDHVIANSIRSDSEIVNGVNLNELVQRSLNNTQSLQRLIGDQNFVQDLTILGNVTVEGLINGQIVSVHHNYAPDVGSIIKSDLISLNASAHMLCPKIASLLPVTSINSELVGVEKVYEEVLPSSTLGEFDSTTINSAHYISIARAPGTTCGTAYVMQCIVFPHCNILQTIETNARVLEFFEYNGQPSLLVDHFDEGFNVTSACPKTPEIYVWSEDAQLFQPLQTVNEDLMQSENAPFVKSKQLMAKSLQKQSKSRKRNVKFFEQEDGDSSVNYLLTTGENEESDYIDLYMVNGTTIGSMKKAQRLIVNNNRKKKMSISKLGNKKILSVSSSYGNDMKLYLFNAKKQEFELYQRLEKSATSVKIEKVKKNQFVFFASPDTGFGLCSWLGVSGFQECRSSFVTDTEYVETVVTDADAYAIMGKRDVLVIYRMMFDGVSTSYPGSIC